VNFGALVLVLLAMIVPAPHQRRTVARSSAPSRRLRGASATVHGGAVALAAHSGEGARKGAGGAANPSGAGRAWDASGTELPPPALPRGEAERAARRILTLAKAIAAT
jgi:hypothetical protein